MLRQASLAPGGVVLMDDALLGGLIQGAVRDSDRFLSLFQITSLNQAAGFFDSRACPAAEHLIVPSPAFILSNILDRRFCVCQSYYLQSYQQKDQ